MLVKCGLNSTRAIDCFLEQETSSMLLGKSAKLWTFQKTKLKQIRAEQLFPAVYVPVCLS